MDQLQAFEDYSLMCICGEKADLNYITRVGRVGREVITVYSVPTYTCPSCGESFMTGSDSITFAQKLDQAARDHKDSINF
ncbi:MULTISPECIES: hypothetical protein [unclassified Paenibacillus]|uniref:hypothetical protein n=1 Tax=unclassified Paenibacillus TaxID=185978 RepID=UPI00110FE4DE|nr:MULTISPECIES: hypothetical protein [unclassified Paenibacillus]